MQRVLRNNVRCYFGSVLSEYGKWFSVSDCIFENIHIEEYIDLNDSHFENVTWKNVTKGPKI
ncbi:MAG: hypothetical protein RL274_1692, partial [Pseudomonadota bacterium]